MYPSADASHNIHKVMFRFYLLGMIMFIIQVLLGGVTRLTGSGLSITSWDVITGFFPPLSEDSWLKEFVKYQSTPQYQIINSHFDLSDFKFIYFWEWIHRFWARCIGVVGALFMIYLWRKKYLTSSILKEIGILFVFGLFQGLIGWIMVQSGLEGDAIYVKPSKLAIHFLLAVGLISLTWVFAMKHLTTYRATHHLALSNQNKGGVYFHYTIIGIIFVQLGLGCFMSGMKAAASASTWPSINGMWWLGEFSSPDGLWWENKLVIHFLHRNTAYILLLLIVCWTIVMYAKRVFPASLRVLYWLPIMLTILQALLGIGSLLVSPYIIPNAWGGYEWLAQIHQVVAICLTLCMVSVIYMSSKKTMPIQ